MRTSFTRQEVVDITAEDLATLKRDFQPIEKNPWAIRLAQITEDLHDLASHSDPDASRLAELEQRVATFLAEDKRNKGMTPYLYMIRSLKSDEKANI